MVLLLVSITVLHLVTLAMLLIATLEKVRPFPCLCESLADIQRGRAPSPQCCLTLIRLSSASFVFSVCCCSPGGSGLIQKSLTSGTTASTTTPQTPGCALPPARTVNHFHAHDWVGWFIYWLSRSFCKAEHRPSVKALT